MKNIILLILATTLVTPNLIAQEIENIIHSRRYVLEGNRVIHVKLNSEPVEADIFDGFLLVKDDELTFEVPSWINYYEPFFKSSGTKIVD